jgi:hypothetical protein
MKRIKLITFSLILLLCSVEKVSAQYYFYDDDYYDTKVTFELGGSLALMNCLTDIGGRIGIGGPFLKDYNIGNTKFGGSIYLAATYNYAVGLRLEYTKGMVGAYDSILKNVAATTEGRYERNLSFRSPISEIALIAEFHPLYIFINWANSDQPPPHLSPYLLAGVGYYHFNPQAKYINGDWVDLQPLHTEGEGFPQYPNVKNYSLNQFNIPWGFGFRYEASSIINVRLEVIDRVLFTDYLDDVSTRYIDPSTFAKNGLSGQQLAEALYFYDRNTSTNPKTRARPGNLATGVIGSIRGDPNNNDNYFTVNFKVGIILGREKIN